MRITDIRCIPVECPLPQPVYDANYIMATKPALLVEVETDEELLGPGEAAHFGGPLHSTRTAIEGELRADLLGEDLRDVGRLWKRRHQWGYKHGRGYLGEVKVPGHDLLELPEPLVVLPKFVR